MSNPTETVINWIHEVRMGTNTPCVDKPRLCFREALKHFREKFVYDIHQITNMLCRLILKH